MIWRENPLFSETSISISSSMCTYKGCPVGGILSWYIINSRYTVDGRHPDNQLIRSCSYHLHCFIHLRWCRISSINNLTSSIFWIGSCNLEHVHLSVLLSISSTAKSPFFLFVTSPQNSTKNHPQPSKPSSNKTITVRSVSQLPKNFTDSIHIQSSALVGFSLFSFQQRFVVGWKETKALIFHLKDSDRCGTMQSDRLCCLHCLHTQNKWHE